jgi:hypothetical protein
VRRYSARDAAFAAAALALAVRLAACASSDGGGISGTAIVSGPISDFGSIVVNGIDFDTTNAEVTIEGDPATVEDLRLGMFVFVRGPVDRDTATGVAERVASDHVLLGPIEGIDVAGGTFTSLSQLVITDAQTVLEPAVFADFAPDDVVEVFGVLDADGNIRATRVEQTDSDEFELTGTVSDLDLDAETFRINLLTVDFSEALLEDLPPGGLADGLLVEVETDEAPQDDVMIATGVEARDPALLFEDGDEAELRGFVTAIVSESEFVLNASQRVFVTDETRFEGGTAADLVLNAEVDVEGPLEPDGSVTAVEIEFLTVPAP